MKPFPFARRGVPLALALLCPVSAFSASSAVAAPTFKYQQHNLVSDGAVPADHTDANLVNPWGIAESAGSPFCCSANPRAPAPSHQPQPPTLFPKYH